ncbi:MAG: ankyrin repeat domain-containing protein [Deltaproteobacteria bacterium]|nr:ankyrin repeat domain-containing protein [Deltaproteobacteria bacterium]
MDSGGGDAYALEFVQVARQIHAALSREYPKSLPQINLNQFRHLIDETIVETTDRELIFNGRAVDAINYPDEKKIVLNRVRWAQIMTYQQKVSLVMHENLGLLRIDDSNYQISSNADLRLQCQEELNILLRRTVEAGCVPQDVRKLIEQGADPRSKNDEGRTALILAAEFCKEEDASILQLMIDHGADVNAADLLGETALHHTMLGKDHHLNTAGAAVLLRAGADVDAVSNGGWTPLMSAMIFYKEDRRIMPEMIQLLLDNHANVNLVAENGSTALIMAAWASLPKVFNALLEKGADANAVEKNGHNALLYAAEGLFGFEPEMVRQLAEAGCNPNVHEKYSGKTPLMYMVINYEVVRYAQLDLIRLLLAKGADVNARDKYGETALAKARNAEVREVLIEAGGVE